MLAWALGLLLCAPAQAGQLVMDFLDVGQGDGVLIRAGGKAVLIDAGTAKSGVAQQLERLGVDRLDLVVATHPHADHIGGMAEVMREVRVALFVDSGQAHTTETYAAMMEEVDSQGIKHLRARPGMTLNLGEEAVLHVLWPGDRLLKDTRSDLNSNSVVLWLEHGEMDALFTGDAEEPTEAALLRTGVERVELLKVAHHGSAHSSSQAFLSRTSPEIAVISCGEGNRYGHPDPGTVSRLESAGATVYRTDLLGPIRVTSDGTAMTVVEGEGALMRVQRPESTSLVPLLAEEEATEQPPPTVEVPDDVAAWLSGVRPSGVPEPEPEGKKKKKKKRGEP